MALKFMTRDDIPADAITVSPSQMSVWFSCRYKWKLSKLDGVDGIPVKEYGAAGDKGLIFHRLQEWYYGHFIGKQLIEPNEKGKAAALQVVQELFPAHPHLWEVLTIWMLYTEWASLHENIVPLAVEQETFAPLGMRSRDGREIYLHGFIDLIGEVDSKLAVVDHKSHTSRPWDDTRLNYDHQFAMYWLLCELQGISVDVAIVNAVDLAVSKNPETFRKSLRGPNRYDRFRRFYRTHKDHVLQYRLDQLRKSVYEMWVNPDTVYDMKLNSDCRFCNYQAHIELESGGFSAQVALQNRFNKTGDFDFEDDSDATDDGC